MDFYAFLLLNMNFDLDDTSYFLVCNAKRERDEFNKKMEFDEYLVPYKWNINWIENKIDEMISLMNNNQIPDANESCKNCAYSEQYAKSIYKELDRDVEDFQGSLF
tara:strand:- start:953 stop:1270 length:318 start_codon:yes stop_codon:yes gene_type:complete